MAANDGFTLMRPAASHCERIGGRSKFLENRNNEKRPTELKVILNTRFLYIERRITTVLSLEDRLAVDNANLIYGRYVSLAVPSYPSTLTNLSFIHG